MVPFSFFSVSKQECLLGLVQKSQPPCPRLRVKARAMGRLVGVYLILSSESGFCKALARVLVAALDLQ